MRFYSTVVLRLERIQPATVTLDWCGGMHSQSKCPVCSRRHTRTLLEANVGILRYQQVVYNQIRSYIPQFTRQISQAMGWWSKPVTWDFIACKQTQPAANYVTYE